MKNNYYKFMFTLLILMLQHFYITSVEAKRAQGVKQIIKFRKYSEVDLSGSTVEGKLRTPEIFYIFQRKRESKELYHRVPQNLNHYHGEIIKNFGKVIP